jgi:hypothetical protein
MQEVGQSRERSWQIEGGKLIWLTQSFFGPFNGYAFTALLFFNCGPIYLATSLNGRRNSLE